MDLPDCSERSKAHVDPWLLLYMVEQCRDHELADTTPFLLRGVADSVGFRSAAANAQEHKSLAPGRELRRGANSTMIIQKGNCAVR